MSPLTRSSGFGYQTATAGPFMTTGWNPCAESTSSIFSAVRMMRRLRTAIRSASAIRLKRILSGTRTVSEMRVTAWLTMPLTVCSRTIVTISFHCPSSNEAMRSNSSGEGILS